jgi:hypothetical protein
MKAAEIYMRSGAIVAVETTQLTIGTALTGELSSLRWGNSADSERVLRYVHIEDVVAVVEIR